MAVVLHILQLPVIFICINLVLRTLEYYSRDYSSGIKPRMWITEAERRDRRERNKRAKASRKQNRELRR